ncbi:MAG: flagellar filament capping protein FliD [Clostridia bacterium]|nr:flagellar filament capping protein FliD [Clostridia bacterium]
MSVNNVTGYSTKFRLGGLATGLDTDQMVSDLMKVERTPVNKLAQRRQLSEWRMEAYREVTNKLRGFKDEFFNFLKPSSNMLSASQYKKFAAASTDSGVVTASATPGASAGTHTVFVNSLASAAEASSASGVTKPVAGASPVLDENVAAMNGKKFNLTLDGITREITIGSYSTAAELAAGLQNQIGEAFGAGKVTVSSNSGILTFATAGGASKLTLTSGTSGADGLAGLNIASGASNRLNVNDTLEALKDKLAVSLTFNAQNEIKFTINDKTFTFKNTTTLSSMMNAVNADSSANVNISYDEAKDVFKLTARQTGAGQAIKISNIQEGNFFAGASGIAAGNYDGGTDASVVIDGELFKRSTNTFTLNGVTYNLLKKSEPSGGNETITISQDIDGVYNNIKSFVEKYNELISNINSKLAEKYDRNYQPLTKEQKEAMKEDEIKKWEEKAKTGLLRNDTMLQNILYNMRSALSEGVKDVSATLSGIGIRTGSYEERGKLIIDEAKLKDAIRKDPDSVMNLFAKQSSTHPSYLNLTTEQRSVRNKEEGLAYRLFDILEDNIRTIRDKDGKKGILLEKAGIQGDMTEFNSLIYKEIKDYDKKIDALQEKLIDRENKYYKKFAALEKAISKMNSQSSWLASQFSSGR